MIAGLRARGVNFDSQPLEVWGPEEACQYDRAGNLVQRYRTLVVRRLDGRWYLVRNVSESARRRTTGGFDYVSEIPEAEARHWLQTHADCRRRTISSAEA